MILNMKNYIIIIILSMLLSSCAGLENDIAISPAPTKTAAVSQAEVSSSPAKIREMDQTPRVLIPGEALTYRNEEAGYQITFPESWQGHYVVTEYGPENVVIGFFGKSKTGQFDKKATGYGRNGIDMFRIETKASDLDVAYYQKKIGEVNGTEYFFRRIYSYLLSDILEPDGWIREYYGNFYEIDEEELALVAQDEKKITQMENDMEDVSKTFMPTK